MAWKRGYYYRNKRVGSRVISEYAGGGYGAELMAQLDAHERHQAALQRKQWNATRDEQDALDRQIDDIGAQVQALVDAVLLVADYHKHHGEWRKQRNGRISRKNAG